MLFNFKILALLLTLLSANLKIVSQFDEQIKKKLLIACKNQDKEKIKEICSQNTNYCNITKNEDLILIICLNNKRPKIAKSLIKLGANINVFQNNYDKNTPLILASKHGYKKVVLELLKHKASINEKNTKGETALIVAAKNGHKNIVKILLKCKANIHIKDIAEATALTEAYINNHEDIIYLLAALNPNVNQELNGIKKLGNSKLVPKIIEAHKIFYYVNSTNIKAVAKNNYLIPFHLRNKDGKTLLHLATEKNDKKMIVTLLGHDTTLACAKNYQNQTPVDIALNTSEGSLDLIILFTNLAF